MNQDNKQDLPVALVTGAARRIGAVIVRHLHHAGFRVMIHCHQSHDAANALAQELNHLRADSARVFSADLSLTHTSPQLIEALIQWTGRLDLLVNNASIFVRDDGADWDGVFTINVKAHWLLSNAAHPYLAATQGSIVNITDIHAEQPLKGYAIYCQSKAAFAMQTKALAREFAPDVRVNAIAPGAITWPEQGNALSETLQREIIAKTWLKQHGNPMFIAQAVLALAENLFITGQILRVDGGR